MTPEQQKQIYSEVFQATKDGRLNWEPVRQSGDLRVNFARSSIELSPENEHNYPLLAVINSNGSIVGIIEAITPSSSNGIVHPDSLKALYEMAHSKAYQTEETIRDILDGLK